MSNPRRKVEWERVCRLCGAQLGLRPLTAHHLVPQSWFVRNPGVPGRHASANIVPLCPGCHRFVDGHIPAALNTRDLRRRIYRMRLRRAMLVDEVDFVVRVRGWHWLEHHYPLTVAWHDG